MFNFLDTFEERSLKLKVLDHEAKEEKEKLEKSLQEVRTLQKVQRYTVIELGPLRLQWNVSMG